MKHGLTAKMRPITTGQFDAYMAHRSPASFVNDKNDDNYIRWRKEWYEHFANVVNIH